MACWRELSEEQSTEPKIIPKQPHADTGILLYHTSSFHLMEEQDRSNSSITTLSVATVNELLPTNRFSKKFQLQVCQVPAGQRQHQSL